MAEADIHSQAFKEEARELLTDLESSLLELEESPDDKDLIGKVFRAMHTIKGSGAMFGFDDIAEFTHDVETVFDLVREDKLKVTQELIDLTLAARDHISAMIGSYDGGQAVDEKEGEKIITGFRSLVPREEGSEASEEIPAEEPEEEANEEVTYRVRFRPFINLFQAGTDPICLINELKDLGDAHIIARTSGIPRLEFYAAEACYTSWDIILTTDKGMDSIKDVFIFVEDDCKLDIQVIDDEESLDSETGYKKVGEILVERGELNPEALERVLKERKLIGELLVEKGLVPSEAVKSALEEQNIVREKREKRQKETAVTTVKVPSDKLDKLVDLVGELVIAQARLNQISVSLEIGDLTSITEELEHLTRELQDNTLGIRMLPIGSTFSRFRRLVRDLSKELGKNVELTTEGAETELDKTVIDRLNDPMVHLIRNSIDHGVESVEEREALGKPPMGKVHLSALHSGANVLIQIKDDGAGLDSRRIREKAVEKGIISADAELSEKEIFSLIFAAGFSTAQKVTNVSGRGVGMDVVRKSIESLRGTVEINSKLGVGTTITLKLPLTLAIIEGLLVQIGMEYYVMPLSAVEEVVELTRDDMARSHGRNITNIRGEVVPFIRLRERFNILAEARDIEQIVVAQVDEQRIGFVVDQVVGQHQTVIKNLGKFYQNVKGVSGATIMGDGTVALILDLHQLFKDSEKDELAMCS